MYFSALVCIGQDSGLVMCYNSSTCALTGEFVNAMTIEECCSNGLAFRTLNETCEPCIGMYYR